MGTALDLVGCQPLTPADDRVEELEGPKHSLEDRHRANSEAQPGTVNRYWPKLYIPRLLCPSQQSEQHCSAERPLPSSADVLAQKTSASASHSMVGADGWVVCAAIGSQQSAMPAVRAPVSGSHARSTSGCCIGTLTVKRM